MSTEKSVCPYFISMSSQVITCRGIATGCELQHGYAKQGIAKAQYTEYCGKNFHKCETARMLNSVWHEIEVQVCPNNRGVDCMNTAECDRCGWKPDVSKRRLALLKIPKSY